MKYIRCKHRGIFLFPLNIRHDKMAEWMGGEIISAGFIKFQDGDWRCLGESMTLRLKALPEDTDLLWQQGLIQ